MHILGARMRAPYILLSSVLACSSPQRPVEPPPAPMRSVLPPPREVHDGSGAFTVTSRTPIRGEATSAALLREELHAPDVAGSGEIVL